MQFSLVIPLYNKADYIQATLQSVLDQNQWPDELTIIDDKSTDQSLHIAKDFIAQTPERFKREVKIRFIELEQNKGPGHARNIGIANSGGDYIGFLDADDLYKPELIQSALSIMQGSKLDFLVMGIQLFPSQTSYPNLAELPGRLSPIELNANVSNAYCLRQPLRTVIAHDFIMGVGSNVFVKRQFIVDMAFAENVSLNEANDFWFRVLKKVIRVNPLGVGLLMGNHIQVREVPQSLSRQRYAQWDDIELPPVYLRNQHSKNPYDKLFASVICGRWLRYSLRALISNRQKLTFLFKHRSVLRYQCYCFFLRVAYC